MKLYDLHSHTVHSDGLLTVQELVTKALQRGFAGLAITDHDTTGHFEEVKQGFDGIEVIPGVEISCFEHQRDIHVLGYYCDETNENLKVRLDFFRRDRIRRTEKMIVKLAKYGVRITMDDVLAISGTAPLGRPHIAQAVVAKGGADSLQHAFDRYFDASGVAYVPKSMFKVSEAVSLIHEAGGVAILAHPGRYFQDPRQILSMVRTGLDGIEVTHPSHNADTTEFYRVFAKQWTMIATAGSDFHGSRVYDDANFGAFLCKEDVLDEIKTKANYWKSH